MFLKDSDGSKDQKKAQESIDLFEIGKNHYQGINGEIKNEKKAIECFESSSFSHFLDKETSQLDF